MRCPACFAKDDSLTGCEKCNYQADQRREGVYLTIGTLLHNGEYIVGKVLGKPGGFGITYLAWDTRFDIKVAIKEYLPFQIAARSADGTSVSIHMQDYRSDFEFGLEKFLEEAKTLAQFRHPNIVRVMNFFGENGTAYMVMDYLEGESLSEYLDRVGKLTGPDAVALFLPILDGLAHIHAKNVLHRDIKPSNIYLTYEGQAILLDFGSARQSFRDRSQSFTAVITPGFAPWEQYHRKGNQGPWTDVYACAATLYFMLTGIVPPDGAERALDDDIESIEELAPDVDVLIVQAISRSLSVRTEDRPQTAFELGELLKADIRPDKQEQMRNAQDNRSQVMSSSTPNPISDSSFKAIPKRPPTSIPVQNKAVSQKMSGAKLVVASVLVIIPAVYFGFFAKDKTPAAESVAVPAIAATTLPQKAPTKMDEPGSSFDQNIAITSVKKDFRERYGSGSSLADYIVLILTVQNKSAKDIDAVTGVMTCKSQSGEVIYSFEAKNQDEIRAGQSKIVHKFVKYDRSNDKLVRLKNTDINDLKMEWRPKGIVFSDGTSINSSASVDQQESILSSGLDIEIPDKPNAFPALFLKTVNGRNGLVNLYASPRAYAAVIGTVKENTEFKCHNVDNGFVFVNLNGAKGWVRRANVTNRM